MLILTISHLYITLDQFFLFNTFYFILFYFILFYFILFYFILFYFFILPILHPCLLLGLYCLFVVSRG